MKSMAIFSSSSLPTHISLPLPSWPFLIRWCCHVSAPTHLISHYTFFAGNIIHSISSFCVISGPSLSRCPAFLLPPLPCPRCNSVEASLRSSFHTFTYLDNNICQVISLLLESLCQVSICNKKSPGLSACTWKSFTAWLQSTFQPHF